MRPPFEPLPDVDRITESRLLGRVAPNCPKPDKDIDLSEGSTKTTESERIWK